MQVIGLCRFSYPALGGFQVEHATLEERIAYLYAPARMDERFRHFQAITLPALKTQTDPDFTFGIVVGDTLPAPYMERLLDLLADFPQAVVLPTAPGEHRPVMQSALNSLRTDINAPCLQFRHDDDDAVSVDYVQILRETAADCAGLIARNKYVAIDFNRGFVARPDAQGIAAMPTMTPYWGVALAMSVQGGVRQTIMNFAHNKMVNFMPTVTRTDADMFVRGHNDYNDSRQRKNIKPEPLEPLDAQGEAHFAARFAIDCASVRRIFA